MTDKEKQIKETFASDTCFDIPITEIVGLFQGIDIGKWNRKYENATVISFRKKGRKMSGHSGPCHLFMTHCFNGSKDNPWVAAFSITRHDYRYRANNVDIKPGVGAKYYDWLLNRSPWAGAHLMKDAEWAFNNGVIVRGDLPPNFLTQALIASRNVWEWCNEINLWADLVDSGMNENAAFIVVQQIKPTETKDVLEFSGANLSHHAFESEVVSELLFKKFRQNEMDWSRLDDKLWGIDSVYGRITPLCTFNDTRLTAAYWARVFQELNAAPTEDKNPYVHPFTKALKAIVDRTNVRSAMRFDISNTTTKQKFVDYINRLSEG